jgi:hypothetical protein
MKKIKKAILLALCFYWKHLLFSLKPASVVVLLSIPIILWILTESFWYITGYIIVFPLACGLIDYLSKENES